MQPALIEHLDVWTAAIETRSTAGRGSSNKLNLYGIKKLRELILELAVRGQLVAQDPQDEPASVPLKKIAAEKARLIKDGKLKKQTPLPPITDDEKPFELPKGWEFVRLAGIINISSGDGLTSAQMNQEGEIPVFGGNGITGHHDCTNITKPTLVIGRVGFYCGSVHVTPDKAWVTDNAFITYFSEQNIYLDFLYWLLKGTNLKENDNATAQPVISGRKIYPIVVGLPPLAEQHRIVAKVNELMSLCDALESEQASNINAHQVLVENLLSALTNAADQGDFQQTWARIAAHFDTLFTTEHSIDQLKQTILQLAVMGKLVAQDPQDEPASVLLKKIAAEKARLVKAGKIKKQEPLPPIAEDEKPFELPVGWAWCRFDFIIDQQYPVSYGVLVPGDHVDDGIPFVRIGDLDINNPAITPEKKISKEIDAKYERTRLIGGEILMAVVGSIGKLGLVPESWRGANIARALCRIKPISFIERDFLVLILQSKFMQDGFVGDTRTLAQPTLNVGLIRNTLTPVSPLAEQHRIVAKVDELMTLCDQIKARIRTAQTTQLHLADVLAEQAIVGTNPV